jgi:hypothetical protein
LDQGEERFNDREDGFEADGYSTGRQLLRHLETVGGERNAHKPLTMSKIDSGKLGIVGWLDEEDSDV